MIVDRTWCSGIITAAIYPVLSGQYYVSATQSNASHSTVAQLFTLMIVFIRLMRFSGIEQASMVVSALSLLPTLLFFIFTLPHTQVSTLFDTSGTYNCTTSGSGDSDDSIDLSSYTWSDGQAVCTIDTQYGALLSFALFCWSGFWNIGTLAGQVSSPRSTFPRVLSVLVRVSSMWYVTTIGVVLLIIMQIPVVFLQSILALVLFLSVDNNLGNYKVSIHPFTLCLRSSSHVACFRSVILPVWGPRSGVLGWASVSR